MSKVRPAEGLSNTRHFLRERGSDLTGFVVCVALAFITLSRLPEVSIFLLPTLLHELFVAVAFLVRDRPKAVYPTWTARLVTYSGTFLVLGFFLAAQTWRPDWLIATSNVAFLVAGVKMWTTGSVLVVVAVWSLRYAFSIEPAARRVVRHGAYRFVRHPVYLGYLLQYSGMCLMYHSGPLAAVVWSWLALTLVRVHFEERVLAETFPEYQEYRQHTGALLPLLGRRNSASYG